MRLPRRRPLSRLLRDSPDYSRDEPEPEPEPAAATRAEPTSRTGTRRSRAQRERPVARAGEETTRARVLSWESTRRPQRDDSVEIKANTILPARRSEIELNTADGLALVGEVALPPVNSPVATLITLHPLPTAGGFMDSHVLKKASYRLPALADIAVVRFNTRGTSSERGTSEGEFDYARAEKYDVAAAIEYAEFHELPNRWLVGWSFGTDLAIMHGHDPEISGAILLSPPLRWSKDHHLQVWADHGKPLVVLVPEFDDYLRPDEATERFAMVPQARVVPIEGGKHLWVGETYVRRALQEIVNAVRPDFGPLPSVWNGGTPSGAERSGGADTG